MARPRKDGVKATYVIDKTLMDELAQFCAETGLSKTATIEKALIMFLNYYEETGKLK